MPNGRHLLKAWRERSKQDQRTLARALGVSDGYLSQILAGLRRPKLELLMKIEALTGVPVSSWAETKRGKSEKRAKSLEDSANVH